MSWSIGYDETWKRDVGYGVPAICDEPGCSAGIDRGLSYVCGGEPYGGEHGCGLFFCNAHLLMFSALPVQACRRCVAAQLPYQAKADTHEWLRFKLTDESWSEWRSENAADAARMRAALESA
jgi:hypothetical protein